MAREKSSLGRQIARVASLIPLLLLLSPILLLFAVFYWIHRVSLHFLIWVVWLRNGKDVLFVSSDSPIWHEYMNGEILPLVKDRAIVLNWSGRKNWPKWSLATRVFRTYSSGNDFNPMVLLFRPFRNVKSFRFFPAFKEWKHGSTQGVEQLRSNLIKAL